MTGLAGLARTNSGTELCLTSNGPWLRPCRNTVTTGDIATHNQPGLLLGLPPSALSVGAPVSTAARKTSSTTSTTRLLLCSVGCRGGLLQRCTHPLQISRCSRCSITTGVIGGISILRWCNRSGILALKQGAAAAAGVAPLRVVFHHLNHLLDRQQLRPSAGMARLAAALAATALASLRWLKPRPIAGGWF